MECTIIVCVCVGGVEWSIRKSNVSYTRLCMTHGWCFRDTLVVNKSTESWKKTQIILYSSHKYIITCPPPAAALLITSPGASHSDRGQSSCWRLSLLQKLLPLAPGRFSAAWFNISMLLRLTWEGVWGCYLLFLILVGVFSFLWFFLLLHVLRTFGTTFWGGFVCSDSRRCFDWQMSL